MEEPKSRSPSKKAGPEPSASGSDESKKLDISTESVDDHSNNSDQVQASQNQRGGGKQQQQQGNQQGGHKKRKPHRRKQGGARHHNKKWKPYNKLSWKEKKELEEIEAKRACLKREERFAEGHPVAPYNTTQFLMEEHNKSENISPALRDAQDRMDAEERLRPRHNLDDEYYDSPNDEDSFIARDFSETYDNIHAEHIETMSKTELVRDYMELEIKVEKLESKLKVYESLNIMEKRTVVCDSMQSSLLDPNSRPILVDQRMKFENDKLKRENSELKRQIELMKSQYQPDES